MAANRKLIAAVRRELSARGDAERAAAQQAYMKSPMPFYGVPVPEVRRIARALSRAHRLPDYASFRDTVKALFLQARRREERYAALDVASDPAYRPFHTARALPLYAALVRAGAWWDFVDEIAARVGDILRADPAKVAPKLRAWARDDDLWIRRTAILSQKGFEQDTDRTLLCDCIEPSLGSDEFFLQKAIGWALRNVAWHDPDWTIAYVRDNAARLSPLSKREALKNLLKSGRLDAIP